MEVKEVGTLIREIRKAKGLTQIEVANAAGIAVNSLRLYESNKRHPRFYQLLKIADALGVDYNAFFDSYITKKLDEAVNYTWDYVQKFYGIDESDPLVSALLESYSQLTTEGKIKAIERVEELTEIPKYKKEPPQD